MRGEAIYDLEVKGHMRLFFFTGVKLGYKRRVKGKIGTTQVKKTNKKNGFNLSMDVRMLELSFILTIANESVNNRHVIFNLSLVLHASSFLGTASLSLAACI